MARVYNDWQVGELAYNGNALEIQCISCVGFKCTDAPLTEDDIFIAGSHDVLCGHNPFFVGRVQPSLEEDGAV